MRAKALFPTRWWAHARLSPAGDGQLIDNEAISSSFHILVVDDDTLVRMGACAMLEDLGHDVTEAGSGAQAIQIVKATPALDLVITDFSMPGMSGVALAGALQNLRPGIRVIIMTGYDESLPGENSANEYARLSKPFMLDDLTRVIARATEQAI